jgi:hypothetical protein
MLARVLGRRRMTGFSRLVAIGLAVLGLAGPAYAQLQAENLLTGLPKGFVVGFQNRRGAVDMVEFVPKGERVDDWTAMVTVHVLHDLDNADGAAFAGSIRTGWEGACKDSKVEQLEDGKVNGFPFVLWRFVCPLNPQTGKPESMWFKAISGADALYSVQYAFRAEVTPEREREALDYLAKASACDTRKAEHPCPAGM